MIARLALDFRAELRWPGAVDIGTAVKKVGNSSVTLVQGLFDGDVCAATAETVIVLMDEATRKSRPFPDYTRNTLMSLACHAAAT